MSFFNKILKIDMTFSQTMGIFVVIIVCGLAFGSICHSQKHIKHIISQNEQIQTRLSKTKSNTDLQKLLAEYHLNSANYSKQLYENQIGWLNLWLLVVGILLTTMAIIAPLRFSANMKQVRKEGEDFIKDMRLRNAQVSKKLQDNDASRNIDLIKFRLEYKILLELQWFGLITDEKKFEQNADAILLTIDNEHNDTKQDISVKKELYSRVFEHKARWYDYNKNVPDAYKKSLNCINTAMFYTPDNLDLYVSKSYILATGPEPNKYKQVIDMLENVLAVKIENAKPSALNTIYYNLAEAYIMSSTMNNLSKALNLLSKVDTTKIHKETLMKDFGNWKEALQKLPDSPEKLQIINLINNCSAS